MIYFNLYVFLFYGFESGLGGIKIKVMKVVVEIFYGVIVVVVDYCSIKVLEEWLE